MPIHVVQNITIKFEILDCFVTNFVVGKQTFKDIKVNLMESIVIPLNEY